MPSTVLIPLCAPGFARLSRPRGRRSTLVSEAFHTPATPRPLTNREAERFVSCVVPLRSTQ